MVVVTFISIAKQTDRGLGGSFDDDDDHLQSGTDNDIHRIKYTQPPETRWMVGVVMPVVKHNIFPSFISLNIEKCYENNTEIF